MLYDRQPLRLESVLSAPASLLPYFLSSASTSYRQTTQRPIVTDKSNFIFFRAVWCLHVHPHPAYPPERAARRRTRSATARCCRSSAGPAAQHRPAAAPPRSLLPAAGPPAELRSPARRQPRRGPGPLPAAAAAGRGAAGAGTRERGGGHGGAARLQRQARGGET